MKVILLLLISMAAIVSGGLWGGAASSSSHSKSKSKVSAPLPVNNAPLIFVGQRPEKRPDSHHKMLEAFEENVLRNHQQQKSLKKQQARNNEHIENQNNIESSASSFSSEFDESTNSYYSYSNNRHDESYSLMASMEEKDIFNHQPFSIEDEERRIFGEESADDEEQQFNQEFDGYDGEEQEEEEAVHQLGRKQKQKPKSKIHHPTPSCKWPDLYRLEVALLLVREGGEIIVCSGNYTGSFVVTKQMTIKGQKTTPKLGMPIIASTINVRADNVIIERLKFFPGFPSRTMAIRTISSQTQTADRLEVRDNIFRNTAGVLLQGTRWSKVHDNLFDNFQPSNVLNSLGFGVSIQSTIANPDRGTLFNEVFNNRFQLQNLTLLESCVGVLIGDGDGGANMFSRVRNNLFRRAGLAGVLVYNIRGDGLTSQATVEHNLFFDGAGSGDGVYIPSSNSHLIQHNKFYQVDNGISLGDLVRPFQPTYAESNTYVNNNRFKNGTGSDLFIDNTGFANVFDDNDAESFCDWSFGQTSQIVLPNNRFLARFCARKRSLSEKHPQVEELLQAVFPNPQD